MPSVLDQLQTLPHPSDAAQAQAGVARWQAAAAAAGQADAAAAVLAHPGGAAWLMGICGNSPFLTDLLVKHPEVPLMLAGEGAERVLGRLLPGWREAEQVATRPLPGFGTLNDLKRFLRQRRQQLALAIALVDTGGLVGQETVMRALSAFGDFAVGVAIEHLLRAQYAQGHLLPPAVPDGQPLQFDSGYVVLAMGKLGARELNYSSDIDLIILYDPARVQAADPDRLQPLMVRLTRQLVEVLEERTADGCVFRTDLRLRPDPASTPLALSIPAAEVYYTSLAQTWERAAMIRARPVAGDLGCGAAFLRMIAPFVWRRHLDFAAIAEVHAIKQQIDSHKGFGQIAVAGHNIKLGAGGIREIEFFAQTQQLIWGGRNPDLRPRETRQALDALAAAGHIDLGTAADLYESYLYLRRLEHRIQMVSDHQTHTLSADPAELARIAAFAGWADMAAFEHETRRHLERVDAVYAELFETPAREQPTLVAFDLDDGTVSERLRDLGFAEPEQAAQLLQAWHTGRRRVTRSERARQLLVALTPALLSAFVATGNPDQALVNFDAFLGRLASGVQLFSLMQAHSALIALVAEIMGEAPSLASRLAESPALLDNFLSVDLQQGLPSREALFEDAALGLQRAGGYEEQLRFMRDFVRDRQFRIGVHILKQTPQAAQALTTLSDLADAAVLGLVPHIETAFAETHGRVPGLGLAVVALGKHGSHEMTVNSDLDLIFIYAAPDGAVSDGPRPLAAAVYYARLAQRILSALTVPVADGTLFQIDMRLRPSGNSGPPATSLEAFIKYHAESAWTWEHMALTRCRPIYGAAALQWQIEDAVRAVLTRPRDPAQLRQDVADMHTRITAHHKARDLWHMKHTRGGMMDIEFLAQYLQLRFGATHPEVLCRNTAAALLKMGQAGVLEAETAQVLAESLRLWQAMQSLMRITIGSASPEDKASQSLRRKLCRLCDAPDFERLRAMVAERQKSAYGAVHSLLF